MQLFYFVRIQVVALDDAFWQHDAGFLDEPSLETTIITMRRIMANPVFRAVWHLVRPQVAPSVRARIEMTIDETPLSSPGDWAAQWKGEYDAITAGPQ
jgi:hypothetical protein